MKKVVSVIIPVYNVEEFIFRTVESVMNQDYKNIEIILSMMVHQIIQQNN